MPEANAPERIDRKAGSGRESPQVVSFEHEARPSLPLESPKVEILNEIQSESHLAAVPAIADLASIAGVVFTLVTLLIVRRVDSVLLRKRVPVLRKALTGQATKLFQLIASKADASDIYVQLRCIRAELRSIRPKLPFSLWPSIWWIRLQLNCALVFDSQNKLAWRIYGGCTELALTVENLENDWKAVRK